MSLQRALLYALANLGYFLASSTFTTYVLFFYTDHLHAPARLVGIAWFLFGFWNTVNDLVFGWLADRVPVRLGRRTLFLLLFSAPTGLAFCFIWSPPPAVLGSSPALFLYFLLLISLYDTLLTAMNTSQVAAFPELVRGGENRSRVSALRQGMGLAGTALGTAVSPLLYARLGWGAVGLLWGGAITLCYLAAGAGIRGSRFEPETEAPRESWRAAILTLARTSAFRTYLGLQITTRFALGFFQISLPFYAAHVLRLSPVELSGAMGAMLAGAVLALPLWPRLLRRVPAPRAGAFAVFYLALVCLAFLALNSWGPLLLVAALIGPAYGGISVVLELIFARVVDADCATTGRSRGGIISGITGTTLRFAPALAGLLLAQVLAVTGYNPALRQQPDLVLAALRWMIVVVPGLALALTGLLLLCFRLDGPAEPSACAASEAGGHPPNRADRDPSRGLEPDENTIPETGPRPSGPGGQHPALRR